MSDPKSAPESAPKYNIEAYGGLGDSPAGIQLYWTKEIEAAKKEKDEFEEQAKKSLLAYMDKSALATLPMVQKNHINLFWSTIEVQLATLYVRPPKVDVSRLFKDQDDDIARVAGIMLERILNSGIEKDGSDFRTAARHGIFDRLVVGMGQLWYRYEVETKQEMLPAVLGPNGEELAAPVPYEAKVNEDSPSDYVNWMDFFWSPCETWETKRWIARRVKLDKQATVKRFGKEKADKLSYVNAKADGSRTASDEVGPITQCWPLAEVFEIWCKPEHKAYWWAASMDEILDMKDDPLKLDDFWPAPQPVASNVTTSRFNPKSDYSYAMSLFEQINQLQSRIALLVEQCKLVGFYDKNQPTLEKAFALGDRRMIAVDNWAMFAEKGGVQGSVIFLPIKEVVETVTQLRVELAAAQQHVYEVLGISDIMRGTSNPNETLGAQELKAQFGSSRIQYKQTQIADWVSAAMRIKANIICTHYDVETIIKQSNIENTPDAQFAQEAAGFLKSKGVRDWRILIESDTMAALDWSQERETRTQFLEATGAFVERIAPLLQAAPQVAPFMMELLRWALGGFKVSKEIENVFDQALTALSQPMPPAPPNPKEQAETRKINAQAGKDEVTAAKIGQEVQGVALENQFKAQNPMAFPL